MHSLTTFIERFIHSRVGQLEIEIRIDSQSLLGFGGIQVLGDGGQLVVTQIIAHAGTVLTQIVGIFARNYVAKIYQSIQQFR